MSNEPGRPTDQLRGVRYEDLLRALGNYIDRHGFTDVLVTQLPDGVLLKGRVIDGASASAAERIASILFSNADLVALLAESERRRSASGDADSSQAG